MHKTNNFRRLMYNTLVNYAHLCQGSSPKYFFTVFGSKNDLIFYFYFLLIIIFKLVNSWFTQSRRHVIFTLKIICTHFRYYWKRRENSSHRNYFWYQEIFFLPQEFFSLAPRSFFLHQDFFSFTNIFFLAKKILVTWKKGLASRKK